LLGFVVEQLGDGAVDDGAKQAERVGEQGRGERLSPGHLVLEVLGGMRQAGEDAVHVLSVEGKVHPGFSSWVWVVGRSGYATWRLVGVGR